MLEDAEKREGSTTLLAMDALALAVSAAAAEARDHVKKSKIMNKSRSKQCGSSASPKEPYCIQILHLEDSPYDAALILDQLEGSDIACSVTHALSRAEFESAIERQQFDIILCDHKVPGYSGFDALEYARNHQPDVPVIILSGALDDEQAVQSLKHGATDYILKERLARLVPAIRRALDEADAKILKEAAEERVREQADLLNFMRDAILVRNMNDQIVYWNPGAENLFGWSAEEAVGKDFIGLLHGDPARLRSAKKSLLQSGDWMGEIRFRGKSGEERTVMSRWNLVRGKDGQPQSILSMNTDMAEMPKA